MNYPISRYLNVQQAYFSGFSADGRRVTFLSNMTGTAQVWQVERIADQIAWPQQRTFDADRVLGVWPAPNDERLIYSHDVGGDENAQLVLLHADGTEIALSAGFERAMHMFGAWSADGSSLLLSANRRDPARFDLYVQPLDGAARLIWQNDAAGYLYWAQFAPDGTRAMLSRVVSGSQHDLIEVDLQTGTARQLSPPDQIAQYAQLCYAADGQSIYAVTDRDADVKYVAQIDCATGQLTPLIRSEWDVEWIALSPDGGALAYAINADGTSTLHLRDLASGTMRTLPQFDRSPGVIGYLDARLSFALDGTALAFGYTSATRTADVWVWDFASDQVWAITRSAHGGLPVDQFVTPDLIHYPTFDARQIPAWFFRPAAIDQPVPAVVIVHGGPEGQTVAAFNFLAQYLLAQGYAVLAPNVRGSTGYGKTYSHLDDVEKRMDSVADLRHAALWLQQQPGIDGERLVVYGGSYGGFMVLAALTDQPDLWAAGVDIVGISNFVTFLENTSAYRRAHREAEYGSLERDRAFLESISPINKVDQIVAPLLVIHGANDPRVPLGEAEQLAAALRARDVPVELLVFDDEGHGIVKLKNKLRAYPAIVAFLDAQLRG